MTRMHLRIIFVFNATLIVAVCAIKSKIYADDKAQNYLMRFGYLPQSDLETGNLRTDDQLRDAIKQLQSFGGLRVTGEIDDVTKKLMTSRRCGLPDIPDSRISNTYYQRTRHKRFTVHGQQWHHKNLTWSLRTRQPGRLNSGGVRMELARALDLWARNSKLTFQEINSDDADILVYFHRGYHGDGYPFDGRGQILAHAFFPGRDRGGDAHFDEEEIWLLRDDTNEEGTSLFAVAAHEFGHSLGLAHSSVRGALMYPWYQGLGSNYDLPEDDRHGIQQMYGAPEDKLWGNIPDNNYPVERQPPTSGTPAAPHPDATTARPSRPRPTTPRHYPAKPRWPDYYPQKPRKPYHRHHASSTTTTAEPATTTTNQPRQRTTTSSRDDVPNKCDTTYDAISVIRREVFIFKGRYLWRIGDQGLYEGYPAEITRLFNLPEDIDHVDAVYERPDKRIVFFIGRQYYVFSANNLEPGYPKPLTALGLPDALDKVDGAMVWGHNSRTYLFSGTMYWRFDESVNYVELDYPRDMSMFSGVGYNIDAVFQWKNGKTYFFKGKGYWEFDDLRMRVAHEKPKLSASVWMGCPRKIESNDVESNLPRRHQRIMFNGAVNGAPSFIGVLLIILLNCCFYNYYQFNT